MNDLTGPIVKDKVKILLVVSFILFFTGFASSLDISFDTYNSNVSLFEIKQYNTVTDNSKIYAETLVRGFIGEKNNNSNFSIWIRFLEQNQFFIPENFEASVCGGYTGSEDYTHFDVVNCSLLTNIVKSGPDDSTFIVNIHEGELPEKHFWIRIIYSLPSGAVIKNGDYHIVWLETQGMTELQGKKIERHLVIDSSDAIFEERNNFDIVTRSLSGKWVFKTEGNGDAILWYRDYKEEQNKRLLRDLALISITIASTIIFSIPFTHPRMTNRTKNLWIVSGLFLFFSGIPILFERGLWISLIFILLFIFFIIFAMISGNKDVPLGYIKKEINVIKKFIKGTLKRRNYTFHFLKIPSQII